jgi:hypothetical protein
MATIYDKGDNWHLVIAPNASYVQTIDEPAKGYSATLGQDPDTGKHVVMDVHYNKSKYSIDDVTKFIEKSRSCPTCAALDKERMKLESIEMREPNPNVKSFRVEDGSPSGSGSAQGFMSEQSPPQIQTRQVQQAQAQAQPQSPLKDIFANVFFDAYLTTPGKYFLGMMLNDDKILETAMPKSPDGIPQFMEEMVDFLAGKIDFVRSPDEVKEYLSVLKKDDDTKTGTSTLRDRRNKKKQAGNAVLIY